VIDNVEEKTFYIYSEEHKQSSCLLLDKQLHKFC